MSFAHVNSDGVEPSSAGSSEEVEDFDSEGRDVGMQEDLDDEPMSLLDFLNARLKKVIAGSSRRIPGLPHPIELELLNVLTTQLNRELISHNQRWKVLKGR